jgi:hypothetical protein|tara:strand:- start:1249 stop:1551 length:303 start_codon:yes stop_codon:yes gene_type:complete
MMSIPKVMIFVVAITSAILFWATSNVCKYNFALEKRTNTINIVTDEIDPSIGNAKYYVYRELNCNNVDFSLDLERVMDNLRTITVIIYQELNTDIRGDPN